MGIFLDRLTERFGKMAGDGERVGVKAIVSDSLRVEETEQQFEIVATANTARVDLDNEVVVPEGADTTYFNANKSILFNHDMNSPIGSMVNMKLLRAESRWLVRMFISGGTPFCRDVRSLLREGVIKGVSIGFFATEAGQPTPEEKGLYGDHRSIVRAWKWMELSVTPQPCNVDALVTVVGKSMIDRATGVAFGLPDTPRRKYHAVVVPARVKPKGIIVPCGV